MLKKTDMKRLVMEIPEGIHKEIKVQAVWKNITMRKYILQAVMEKIAHDKQYQ